MKVYKKCDWAISSSVKLKSRVSFVQLKPMLDIVLQDFSLSSCPQHSQKVLLLLNPMYLLKYVLNCEQNFSYFDPH
jgi:hypothetical protein